jgi:hypothetical protein
MQENINKQIVELHPITTIRDKKGFRFYSTDDGNTLYAEKNGKIYNVSSDSLNVLSEVFFFKGKEKEFVGIINDEDIKDLHPLHYEYTAMDRTRKKFSMAKGGELSIGDKVTIDNNYGGGSGVVSDIYQSFIIVETKDGKQSFHESNLSLENDDEDDYAKGGELESKKQNLLEFLNWFPSDAKSWGQATDELRDLARMARITYLEVDEKEFEPLDFKTLKTPSEWNTKGKLYIFDMYLRMSDEAKKEFLDAFEQTFDTKMAHGGETHDLKILFTINDEKIDDLLRNSNLNYEFMDDDGYLMSFSDYEKFKVMVSDKGYDENKIFVSEYDYANGGELTTITKEEWSKKQKDSKLKTKDGKYYIMKYDDKIGTYLQQVKVLEDKQHMANGGMFNYSNAFDKIWSIEKNGSPYMWGPYTQDQAREKIDEEYRKEKDDRYSEGKSGSYYRIIQYNTMRDNLPAIERMHTPYLDESAGKIILSNAKPLNEGDLGEYAQGGMIPGRYYKDNKGEEYRFVGESRGKLLFKDGEKVIEKSEDDFDDLPKETGLFGFFEKGGELEDLKTSMDEAYKKWGESITKFKSTKAQYDKQKMNEYKKDYNQKAREYNSIRYNFTLLKKILQKNSFLAPLNEGTMQTQRNNYFTWAIDKVETPNQIQLQIIKGNPGNSSIENLIKDLNENGYTNVKYSGSLLTFDYKLKDSMAKGGETDEDEEHFFPTKRDLKGLHNRMEKEEEDRKIIEEKWNKISKEEKENFFKKNKQNYIDFDVLPRELSIIWRIRCLRSANRSVFSDQ